VNIEQLKQLISTGESNRLEFKKSTTQIKAAFETLCAFLNGAGGSVLIGIADNGQIVGQQVSDKTKQELAREISKIEPKISPEVHFIDIGKDKQVIVIETPSGSHIPFCQATH
jgi:ATP-dependent DNA helicase RecG